MKTYSNPFKSLKSACMVKDQRENFLCAWMRCHMSVLRRRDTTQDLCNRNPEREGKSGCSSSPPPVPAALGINVATGLAACPEIMAKPVMITSIPCSWPLTPAHPDNQNCVTSRTSNKRTEFLILTSLQCINCLLLAENLISGEMQISCSSPVAVIPISTYLLPPQ